MNRTVILAAGNFPAEGSAARRLLACARRVVACDSAADEFLRVFARSPDVVVGDCDSVKLPHPNVVRCSEQDTNDLAKAIRYCRSRGWKRLVIVGATGKREDHTLGNIFRALAEGIEVVADKGTFYPVLAARTLKVRKGAGVSVFAVSPETEMTSKGLEWPLDGVRFEDLYSATLNRAKAGRITVSANRPVFVYVEE
jgi:thiamine pyrophosphokinase